METQELKNELNLIFDEWEDNNPIPNGKKIFNDYDLGIGEYIADTYDIKVNYHKVDDLKTKKDSKFFYLIEHRSVRLEHILSKKYVVSDKIIELIKKNKNFNLLFLDGHESYLTEDFESLKKFIIATNIPENRIFIINNNHLTKKQIKNFNLNINYHSNILIPTGYVCSIMNNQTNLKINKLGKFFICLNNMKKKHRLVLLSNIKKLNILDDVNWSYREGECTQTNFDDILTIEQQKYLKDEIKFFNSIIKNADFENISNDNFYIGHISEIKYDQENSYVNIVTESLFSENDVVQITEKSLKPFFYYQIPIFCSTHSHVKSLKEKYNFDLFDDIVNHDYDKEINHQKRMCLIVEEIKKLYNKRNTIKNIYPTLKDRLEENKYKLLNILNIKDDDVFFKKITNG
jgi:hypothetical protein